MKKSAFLAAVVSLIFNFSFLTACGKDSGDSPANTANVSVSPEALTASSEAQTLELNVKAGAAWEIKTAEDWVKLSPIGGFAEKPVIVKVSVAANPDVESRTSTLNIISGGNVLKKVQLVQYPDSKAIPSVTELSLGAQESSSSITVSANTDWEISTSDSWLSATPSKGGAGDTQVIVKATANDSKAKRSGSLYLKYGEKSTKITVTQLDDNIVIPDGYTMVWHDEFNEGTRLGSDWVHENWPAGYVNNELQIYTDKTIDGKRTTEIKDGLLLINCFKGNDGKIYSGRVNAKPSTGWLYGYFEARMCLPKGKGTWPAFWMMPCNVDWNTNPWPKCGEIDIMEEVGADPDQVSSSLHTWNYNHTKNTQKTHAMYCAGAEGSFHVYALEWTPDEITTYVDGKVQLKCTKAQMGADHDSWPFHYAFYPILNLAWGGSWGGYKGVDDKALPVTLKIDYVRIFQKK